VYVDGFNLYYGALKGTKSKWLDLKGDLSEAVRIVRRELRKTVLLAVPGDPAKRPPSVELKRWASYTMQIKPDALAAAQLPDPIPGTNIHKPAEW
jgi:hypothetical protein